MMPTFVTIKCGRCGDSVVFPEGDRSPPCSCSGKPPEPDVYQLVEPGSGKPHKFYAISRPIGQRPVEAWGDSRDAVVRRVWAVLAI